jgi:hypothetical protein
MILYQDTYEREGNDAWLIDTVKLFHEDGELYLYHRKNWKGWGEPIKETYTLDLDIDDIKKSQIKLDEYIDNNSLFNKYHNGVEEGIQIKLTDYFN